MLFFFFFSSRRRHTRWPRDWSSDVCSSDLRSACLRVREQAKPSKRAAALWPRFEDQVERRFGGAPETGKAAGGDYLPQALFAGLCAERRSNFLRKRGRRAEQRRGSVERASNRIEIVLEFVTRERLDDHPCAVLLQRAPYMRRGARGIPHVVQAIEERNEIIVLARIVLGFRDLETDAVGNAGILCALLGGFDGFVMIIEGKKLGLGIMLRHQNGGSAETAADIGHARAVLEFGFNTFERRNPVGDQIGGIAGTEESLSSDKQLRVMLVPAEALTGLEPFGQLLFRARGSQRHLERARHEAGTCFVRHGESLLIRKVELGIGCVVSHIAPGCLGAEPFANVAFRGAGALGKLGRGLPAAGGKRFVESEFVADANQRGVKRRAEIYEGFAQKFMQFVLIDVHASSPSNLTAKGGILECYTRPIRAQSNIQQQRLSRE